MTTGTGIGRAPPTEAERLLQESGASGNTEAVLGALSRCRLHVMVARLHADTPGFTAPFPSQYDPVTGRTCVPVLTSGMVPAYWPTATRSASDRGLVWSTHRATPPGSIGIHLPYHGVLFTATAWPGSVR